MTVTRPPADVAPPQPVAAVPLGSYVSSYWRRVRGGEMGSLPAVLAIIVLAAGFTTAKPVFLSEANFANLLSQSAVYVVTAMGIVFVLLIGEIDLSAGWAAGVCAAVMAKLSAEEHLPWYVCLLAAIVTGTVIGTLLGTLVARFGIPSFVVTLAAFLAFQGVLLWLVHEGQVILIPDKTLLAINNKQLPVALGWAFYGIAIAGFAVAQILRKVRRAQRGLISDPSALIAFRIGAIAALGGLAVYVLSLERSFNTRIISLKGVPMVVPIVVVLLVVLTFVLKRTRYGLHLYAVGGNAEAARRAGINVQRVRISAFMICSTLAAIGGIVLSSRDNSVNGNTGGSNLLLFAVGAAVIGGTSLFGGRGRVIDAVLGGVVVAIIDNGMALLGARAWVKFVVTGLVLLVAAGVDALARRRSSAGGLR